MAPNRYTNLFRKKKLPAQSKRVSDPDDEFRKREQEYQNKLAQMEGTLVLTLSKIGCGRKRISELLNKSSSRNKSLRTNPMRGKTT